MRPNLPPLNALRTFEAAARHLNFSRAAAELHVTPSAVSHQIKDIERQIGITLFLREKRSLRLTDAGEVLLRWHNKVLGNVSPEVFIPIAEETGLVNDIFFWVLRTACRQQVEWQTHIGAPLKMSINVCGTPSCIFLKCPFIILNMELPSLGLCRSGTTLSRTLGRRLMLISGHWLWVAQGLCANCSP